MQFYPNAPLHPYSNPSLHPYPVTPPSPYAHGGNPFAHGRVVNTDDGKVIAPKIDFDDGKSQ